MSTWGASSVPAVPVDPDLGNDDLHAWGNPSPAIPIAETDETPLVETYGGKRDSYEREAEWALALTIQKFGNQEDDMIARAMAIITTKRRLADKLRKGA